MPTIKLNLVNPMPGPSPLDPPRYDVAVAKGRRPDGCGATVVLDSDPQPSMLDIRGEHWISILTPGQLDAVRKGTQIFIEVEVGGCGW